MENDLKSLHAFEPGTARAQERLQIDPRISRKGLCRILRANSEPADEMGDRGGRGLRNRKVANSSLQSANPHS
eukprot:14549737-Alexandrium_andersonii.AAC.1